ncbi:LysE family transporter [Bacteroidales bacterium OttesenSCG-928-I21]|nr:LysE family transporter [Bacteroidales bacterium OttesenSCG-928-I21]
MFDFILKGFLIGFLVSIPVGPIAVLCTQRTLNKGRWHGFVTGLGAAFSDMIYALITSFGMTIVMAFLSNHQYVIQILGSIVICVFGIYIFRSNPLKQVAPAISTAQNYIQDFFSAFLMTITNPAIIFFFIGLYARFNFIEENISFLKAIGGVFTVFIGAATWWFLLVSFVNLFRKKINIRSLGLVNKITGSLIVVISIIALCFSISGNTIL